MTIDLNFKIEFTNLIISFQKKELNKFKLFLRIFFVFGMIFSLDLLVKFLILKKMKKILLLATLAIFSVTAVNAQKSKAKKATKAVAAKVETPKTAKTSTSDGAGMVFENETIDYGTIPHNADGNREFVLTNNGNKALVIESTQGSCGCTVPTKPEKPIQPGEKGIIKVHYATDRVGAFTKTVTVTSNAVGSNVTPVTTPATTPGGAPVPTGKSTKVLTIKGTVLPDAPAANPATPATETKS